MTTAIVTPAPAVTDPTPPPTEVPAGDSTLYQLLERAGNLPVAVRLTSPDVDVVVLSHRDEQVVEVMLAPSGAISTVPVYRAAEPITDPGLRADLLTQALSQVLGHTRRIKTNLDILRAESAARIVAIRDYAVARHVDGQICREGLNEFLTAFDLEPYEPTIRVQFTITGSYLVRGSDLDGARYDARNYLTADLSDLDDVVEDSADTEVHLDDVTELHDQ